MHIFTTDAKLLIICIYSPASVIHTTRLGSLGPRSQHCLCHQHRLVEAGRDLSVELTALSLELSTVFGTWQVLSSVLC